MLRGPSGCVRLVGSLHAVGRPVWGPGRRGWHGAAEAHAVHQDVSCKCGARGNGASGSSMTRSAGDPRGGSAAPGHQLAKPSAHHIAAGIQSGKWAAASTEWRTSKRTGVAGWARRGAWARACTMPRPARSTGVDGRARAAPASAAASLGRSSRRRAGCRPARSCRLSSIDRKHRWQRAAIARQSVPAGMPKVPVLLPNPLL